MRETNDADEGHKWTRNADDTGETRSIGIVAAARVRHKYTLTVLGVALTHMVHSARTHRVTHLDMAPVERSVRPHSFD